MTEYCPDCKQPLIEFDLGSGNLHCANPHCDFRYLESLTRIQHRKKIKNENGEDESSFSNLDEKPKRILVGLAIESTLLSMDQSIFDKVIGKLRQDYNANVFDCLENPKYLKNILERNFDKNVRAAVVKSIKTILGEFSYYASIQDFLDGLL